MHLFSYIKTCSAFSFLWYNLWSYVQSGYWYLPELSWTLFTCCTYLCVYWMLYERAHEFLCWQLHFWHRPFRDVYSVLSFSAPLLLWAFQKQMGFAFPFLNRFMNSRINVLLQFSFIGSTHQLKSFPRNSILLGFLTLHRSSYRWSVRFDSWK